jgi:tRNA pseudouridine38-40 synthase
MATRRIAVTLCYDGINYCGWQKQAGRRGVGEGSGARRGRPQAIQEVLEDAVEKIFRERVKVTGASRTDAGVHALGQVAHFDVRAARPETERVPVALNSVLPSGIRVVSACETSRDFSARFSAHSKCYRYIIENAATPSPFLNHYAWHIRSPLNLSAMKKAARLLKGRHDWTSFAASQDERKNRTCRVSRISIRTVRNAGLILPQSVQDPDLKCKGLVIVEVEADFFLYHMVRNIVGTLVEVGLGRIPPFRVKAILSSKDRRTAGPTAPPHGLYLVKVKYDR